MFSFFIFKFFPVVVVVLFIFVLNALATAFLLWLVHVCAPSVRPGGSHVMSNNKKKNIFRLFKSLKRTCANAYSIEQ